MLRSFPEDRVATALALVCWCDSTSCEPQCVCALTIKESQGSEAYPYWASVLVADSLRPIYNLGKTSIDFTGIDSEYPLNITFCYSVSVISTDFFLSVFLRLKDNSIFKQLLFYSFSRCKEMFSNK